MMIGELKYFKICCAKKIDHNLTYIYEDELEKRKNF